MSSNIQGQEILVFNSLFRTFTHIQTTVVSTTTSVEKIIKIAIIIPSSSVDRGDRVVHLENTITYETVTSSNLSH